MDEKPDQGPDEREDEGQRVRRKAIPGLNPPTSNQVQYEVVKASPGRGEAANRMAGMIVSAAETPTRPTPMTATSFSTSSRRTAPGRGKSPGAAGRG